MLLSVISKEYVHVAVREPLSRNPEAVGEIYLAPFGGYELQSQLPFKPEYTEFDPFPEGVDPTSVGQLLFWFDADKYATRWGIYTDKPSPDSFVGITGITESSALTAEGPMFSKDTQEVHIGLFSKEHFGRAIGTTAVLAAMKYAIERHNTQSFYSYTSEWNTAMHRMMQKLGFVMLERRNYIAFQGGEGTEYWMAHNLKAQRAIPKAQRPPFMAAWQRLEACMSKIDILPVSQG